MIELPHRPRYNDDGKPTKSSTEQEKTEVLVGKRLHNYRLEQEKYVQNIPLKRESHVAYLEKTLEESQPSYMVALDASRPWMLYWCLNALDLLGKYDIIKSHSHKIIRMLSRCQHQNGGFGGGPHQDAHLAPTFAAINCLKIIGTEEAMGIINKEKLFTFLKSLKVNDGFGGMRMHQDGEIDIRAIYCGLAAATHAGILPNNELTKGLTEHIIQCQRFEGGFGAYPGMEAHGGYTFCGLAALLLLNELEKFEDTDSLTQWLVFRQCSFEGGFQGRTNKLVDGCYSYWQGAAFPLLSALLTAKKETITKSELIYYDYINWRPKNVQGLNEKDDNYDLFDQPSGILSQGAYPKFENGEWLFDETGLQEYILLACQHSMGGLIDKPGMHRDLYHTCYTLSGLSVSQHHPTGKTLVLGKQENLLREINPLFGICKDRV